MSDNLGAYAFKKNVKFFFECLLILSEFRKNFLQITPNSVQVQVLKSEVV